MMIKQYNPFILKRMGERLVPIYYRSYVEGSRLLNYFISEMKRGKSCLLPDEVNELYYPIVMNEKHLYVCELDFTTAKNTGLDDLLISIYYLSYKKEGDSLSFVNDVYWSELSDEQKKALIEGLSHKDCLTREQMNVISPRILRTRVQHLTSYTISHIHILLDYLKPNVPLQHQFR